MNIAHSHDLPFSCYCYGLKVVKAMPQEEEEEEKAAAQH
jgi:hypothetical protein